MQSTADYPFAQSLHDTTQLLPDGLLEVTRLREVFETSDAGQFWQQWNSLLWCYLGQLPQQVHGAI